MGRSLIQGHIFVQSRPQTLQILQRWVVTNTWPNLCFSWNRCKYLKRYAVRCSTRTHAGASVGGRDGIPMYSTCRAQQEVRRSHPSISLLLELRSISKFCLAAGQAPAAGECWLERIHSFGTARERFRVPGHLFSHAQAVSTSREPRIGEAKLIPSTMDILRSLHL